MSGKTKPEPNILLTFFSRNYINIMKSHFQKKKIISEKLFS